MKCSVDMTKFEYTFKAENIQELRLLEDHFEKIKKEIGGKFLF